MTTLNLPANRSWKNAEANLRLSGTRADCASAVAHAAPDSSGNVEGWRTVLATLRVWERDPAQRADEGIEAPSLGTIQATIDLAQRCQAQGIAPPDDITTDANGGIILRRHQGDVSEEYHLSEDGVEYRSFVGTRLDERIRYGAC